MTEEEMRQKLIEKDDVIEKLNNSIKEKESKLATFDTEKKMFEDRITELREYNKSLFLRISNKIEPEPEKKKEEEPKTKSIEDIIKELEG